MLCAGTFGFPFRLNSMVPLLTLTFVGMAAIGMITLAYHDTTVGGSLLAPGRGAFLGAVGGVIACGWLAMWAIYGVTIVTETASGCAVIEDWPNVFAMEGASAIFYAAVALAVAGAPGSLAGPVASMVAIPKSVVFGLSLVLLFPPLFLSVLERHSPFDLFSPAIWGTVTHAWRAWLLFYLLTSATAIVIVAIAALANLCGWVPGFIVLSFLLAAGGMTCFRLLGRLAWFCSGRWTWEDEPEQIDEDSE
jgi:hypothetical protein